MDQDINKIFLNYGFKLTEKQIKQFDIYFDVLSEWNKKMNLTAIENPRQVYLKHFLDSLMLGRVFDLNSTKMLDVGSGAGFPSIPLKIVYPSIELTIIDALKKRIAFLNHLCNVLGINANLIHGRIEEHKDKGHYDIVTGRAVSSLNVLLEFCVPYVKVGGAFVAYKSSKYALELDKASNAFEALRIKYDTQYDYEIDEEFRTLIKFEKNRETPEKYPRRFKKIKSQPL
jgi:16S rRNA (guanine527-N7)-methyltransferase